VPSEYIKIVGRRREDDDGRGGGGGRGACFVMTMSF